jgi:hypothetical protein
VQEVSGVHSLEWPGYELQVYDLRRDKAVAKWTIDQSEGALRCVRVHPWRDPQP